MVIGDLVTDGLCLWIGSVLVTVGLLETHIHERSQY